MRLEHLLSGAYIQGTNPQQEVGYNKRNDIKSDKASALEPLSTSRNKFYFNISGGLAQLARALAWHARGHRFDPDILHSATITLQTIFDILDNRKVHINRRDSRQN